MGRFELEQRNMDSNSGGSNDHELAGATPTIEELQEALRKEQTRANELTQKNVQYQVKIEELDENAYEMRSEYLLITLPAASWLTLVLARPTAGCIDV